MSSDVSGEPEPKARGGFVRWLLGALLFVVILVGAALGAAFLYGQHVYTAPGVASADGEARTSIVPNGASVRRIGEVLVEDGVIEDAMAFRVAVRLTDATSRLKAGEYAFPSGASLEEVIGILEEGRAILHPVTIPEGLTSAEALRRIAESEVLTGDIPEVVPAEGVLLPDTYMVQRNESREAVVSRMISAQRNVMDELWPERQPGLPFDTREEALILASIVEKETGLAAERPEVAAVFVNRLRRGMRLESDPTIIYGISQGVPLGRGLRRSEIDRRTPYNTYQIDGLPPTPICNPGRDAIAAVLDPPVTKHLFFVADGSGGHAFATTYSEHLRNVAHWRQVEAARKRQGN